MKLAPEVYNIHEKCKSRARSQKECILGDFLHAQYVHLMRAVLCC